MHTNEHSLTATPTGLTLTVDLVFSYSDSALQGYGFTSRTTKKGKSRPETSPIIFCEKIEN